MNSKDLTGNVDNETAKAIAEAIKNDVDSSERLDE